MMKIDEKGLTALEIMIALAIVAILTGLAFVPTISISNQMTFNQSVANVQYALQQARNQARSRQEYVTIIPSNSPAALTIEAYTNSNNGTTPFSSPDPNPSYPTSLTLPSNVNFGQFMINGIALNPFYFIPTGGTSKNSDVTFTMTSGVYSKTFTITYTLGQIEQSL